MLAIVLLVPAAIALAEVWSLPFPARILSDKLFGFCVSILLSLLIGTLLSTIPHEGIKGNSVREGFAIVTFGWIVLTFFGCIPLFVYFIFSNTVDSAAGLFGCFTDAYFEIMSGFTTTGATIITDIEILPRGLLFWRSMTHWLGGMGIVTLVLAVFPAFGITAYQMFRGEVPGPTAERLRPRLGETAKILWGVYTLLTLAETVLLFLGGMSIFEALCHAFGTMATGGFSTRNASIAAYNSDYIDWVVIVFMFFAGMNFMIHYSIIFSGNFTPLRSNREFRFYLSVILGVIIIGSFTLRIEGINTPAQIARSFRPHTLTEEKIESKREQEQQRVGTVYRTVKHVAFQVVSLTTTTGYCTADFDVWPSLLRLGLVLMMFFGGCAGSTGGGMKMVRMMVIVKSAWREVVTMISPRLIAPIKIGNTALDEKQVTNIFGFVSLFIMLFIISSIVMSFMIPDVTTAVSTVVSTICNIGPGLSGIGATENYAWIPLGGKWVLTACMLLGRLEVYTVIITFTPMAWRK
jgi:trk system potassium uptake protein TrkH